MIRRVDGVRMARPLFQEEGDGSIPISTLQLQFDECGLKLAMTLNRHWHSRLPKTSFSNLVRTSRRICYSAEYANVFYAVAIWTTPVARALPQEWFELRRMAISQDSPKNLASRMLGWMKRDIGKRFPEVVRLVSYQDTEVHSGTIYCASGWERTRLSDGDDWVRPNRVRNQTQTKSPKQRWEKAMK